MKISAAAFESFARLAGALSLLALCKIGRGSGWHRARQRVPRTEVRSLRGAFSGAPAPAPSSGPKHHRVGLHAIVAGAWIVMSILLLGYATIEGELAFADLDGLELVTTYAGPLLLSP